MAIMRPDGRVIWVNSAAEQLFGISCNQLGGRQLTEILPDMAELGRLVARAADEQQSFGQALSFSVPQQARFNIEVVCRVSPHAAGDIVVELFDATHWRQIDRERALINQRGVSRRIISRLAHEVRNPLGGLRGAAQLLQRELSDPELREFTRVIIGEADRLVALTDNLLGPTRKPDTAPANIHEVTEHVVLLIQAEAPAGVRIYRDYDPSLPSVIVDRDQLIQAFLNIARNAIQAVGEAGDVIVRTRAVTGYVIGHKRHPLVVSTEFEDNGPGIPEELEDSIFYPLVTGRDEGTGFGLPMAQDLVSRQGGLIEYESEPGRTVFMVRLPVEA